MATGGGCCGASPPLVVVSGSSRDVLDESVYQGSEVPPPPPPLWADVPADILGTVLGFLPCVADRASVRSVCRHWRAATRVQTALPAPLPVLVLPRFRFLCLTSDGALTSARRAPMPVEVAGDDVRIVGSCDDWLMAFIPSWRAKAETGAECFLVHALSSEVVHLPCLHPRPCSYIWLAESRSAPPIRRLFSGTKEQETRVVLSSAVLSASPSSGSKYNVAALCYHMARPGLALWQPGMTSWYLCRSAPISNSSKDDPAFYFYQGKLYVICRFSRYAQDISAFELREDEHGVSLSCPEQYRIDPLIIPSNPTCLMRCDMVVWRGKLLLIIRFFSDSRYEKIECKPRSVEVFALEFSTSHCGATQIHHFDGDCIFVQRSGCRSFSAGLHLGVEGDLIYFSDEWINSPYVYNMRDGTVRRLAAGRPKGCNGFPIWSFPSS